MVAEHTAVEYRAQDTTFVATCQWSTWRARLPLHWPTPPDTPPSPKTTYRSEYVYRGCDDLDEPAVWEHLSEFDLLLRFIDFAGLRPVLACLLGWTSARGYMPFDPVSIFLLLGWQITQRWTRAQALRNLADPRYADYARRFGFQNGVFPTEGGLRYYLTALGQHSPGDTLLVDEEQQLHVTLQRLNTLIAQSVTLIRDAGLLSQAAWQHALICPDGMIHRAASRMDCTWVTGTCYRPSTPEQPRPCPARDKGREGCRCDTLACARVCRYAPTRDPEARCVYYAGSNAPGATPNRPTAESSRPPRGKLFYGYRSLPLQLSDAERHFSLVLFDDVHPANAYEPVPIAAHLRQLSVVYPTLQVDAVAGDANFGHDLILHIAHDHVRARRVIDLRAHETDRDPLQWPLRGYDDKGRPTCPFGYTFTANGFETDRLRHKWFCSQACLHGAEPVVRLPDVTYPPPECAYQSPAHPHGEIRNIAECFADKSIRLVRDVPVGTPTWKELYHRGRNAVESRNAAFENWGLKRVPVFGLPRVKALIFQADVWLNLTTLARLVREATTAACVT
jgi:hypothetical protein